MQVSTIWSLKILFTVFSSILESIKLGHSVKILQEIYRDHYRYKLHDTVHLSYDFSFHVAFYVFACYEQPFSIENKKELYFAYNRMDMYVL